MSGYITRTQYEQLIKPINPRRVNQRDGMSYLEAYDVRAHLNRCFGFGRWSADLLDLTLLYETERKLSNGKDGVAVAYRATVRLTVCAPDGTQLATYTEAAAGDGVMPVTKRMEAHDFAIKTAESQALKRCATNLGDGWGLSLYAKGSTSAIVGRSLVVPDYDGTAMRATEPTEPVDQHVTEVPPEDEHVDPVEDNHEQSEPPQEPAEDARALRIADLRAQLLNATKRADVAMVSAQVMKEKLGGALTDDGENVLTLGALADAALKRVTVRGVA